MAYHCGILASNTGVQVSLDSPSQLNGSSGFVTTLRDGKDVWSAEDQELWGHAVTVGSFVNASTYFGGSIPTSYGRDFLFERIWFSPTDVDAGFITEATAYDIVIWNAYQTKDVVMTSVTVSNPTGTSLSYPTVPFTIRATGELLMSMAITALGPALQDTYYRFQIDGVIYSIYAYGIRAIGVWAAPEWGNGVNTAYAFQTVMFSTERFLEQRRPLMDRPMRTLSARYLLESMQAQRFFVSACYGHDKVFGVPIYNEMMGVQAISTLSPTVTLRSTTPTTNLYSLNTYATHCAIVDHANAMVEVKEISSKATGSITFANNVTKTFNANTTAIYPIFFGMLRSVRFNSETDSIDSVDVDFTEYSNGQ